MSRTPLTPGEKVGRVTLSAPQSEIDAATEAARARGFKTLSALTRHLWTQLLEPPGTRDPNQ